MGNSPSQPAGVESLHDFKDVKDVDGNPVDFAALKGKVDL